MSTRRLLMGFRIVLSVVLVVLTTGLAAPPQYAVEYQTGLSLREFSHLMASLSEPEGYFDSDNFVSNEAAYLKVMPAFRRLGVRGGVYLGVGPDQNYSYVAETWPVLAILIDIRKQSVLQHLYYKALFQLSADRLQYLERLFGREVSLRTGPTQSMSISQLLELIDRSPRNKGYGQRVVSEALGAVRAWNIGLSATDLDAIRYIASAFIEGGPDLKFTSYHRSPRPHHPTYRTLLEETDSNGVQSSFLAQERRFQFIKMLHRKNLILPIVGDLGGPKALRSVADELRRRNLSVECFYVSNVEFYLFGGGRWPAYVQNIRNLPWSRSGVLIRSYANMWQVHPAQIPGYYMTSLLQSVWRFLDNEAAGRNETYWNLVTHDYIAH